MMVMEKSERSSSLPPSSSRSLCGSCAAVFSSAECELMFLSCF